LENIMATISKEENKVREQFDKAKDAGSDMINEGGKDFAGAVKEVGTEAWGKAKDVGAGVVDKAKEAATAVGGMATSAAAAVGHKADDLTAAAGHEIKGFGDTLAKKSPHEGLTGAASQAVAEGMRGSGRYLEEAKLSGMAQDVEKLIKNHPVPALLVCLGIGFCIGRALKD
jgi:hypothetical protein